MQILIDAKASTLDAAAGCTTDAFDDLFDLFWDDPNDSTALSFGESFVNHVLTHTQFERRRMAASLLLTARRRGGRNVLGDRAVLALLASDTFASLWIPAEVRRVAAGLLYRLGSRCPKQSDEQIHFLLNRPPARRDSGHLDLWYVGALLHYADKQPYAKLLIWFSVGSITAAYWDDPVDSVVFRSSRRLGERSNT